MKTLDVSSSDFLDMAESPSYNRLSFGGASVSFRAPVSRFASCPFEEGEIVKVVWRGKTLLIGPAIDLEHSLEGTSESWDIRICDYWWNLSQRHLCRIPPGHRRKRSGKTGDREHPGRPLRSPGPRRQHGPGPHQIRPPDRQGCRNHSVCLRVGNVCLPAFPDPAMAPQHGRVV